MLGAECNLVIYLRVCNFHQLESYCVKFVRSIFCVCTIYIFVIIDIQQYVSQNWQHVYNSTPVIAYKCIMVRQLMLLCQKLNTCRPCVAAMLMYILPNSYSNKGSLFYEICIITENIMILVSFVLQMLALWYFWRYKIQNIKKVSYSAIFNANLLSLYLLNAFHCVCFYTLVQVVQV